MLAAEGEQLPREVGGTERRRARLFRLLAPGVPGRQHLEQQVGRRQDGRQQVVEVVRDSPGEPSHRFHFLGLIELLLEALAFGNVVIGRHDGADDRIVQVVRHHDFEVTPGARLVLNAQVGPRDAARVRLDVAQQALGREAIVGVHELERVVTGHLARLVPQRRRHGLAAVDDVAAAVQERDDVARELDELAETLLALRLRLRSRGGVPHRLLERHRPAHRRAEPMQPVLHDVVRRSGLDVLGRGLFIERAGHDDHGSAGAVALHHPQGIRGGEVREGVIRQDDVRSEISEPAPQLRFTLHAERRAIDAGVLELAENQRRVGLHIFHQQDAERLAGDRRPPA